MEKSQAGYLVQYRAFYRKQLMRFSETMKEDGIHYYFRHDQIILHDDACYEGILSVGHSYCKLQKKMYSIKVSIILLNTESGSI